MSKEWEEKGTLNYLLDDENQTVYRSVSATLTKWNGADFEYELTYGDPSYGNANPSTIQFNVNDDLQIELVNGWYSSATTPTAWYYYPFSDCNTIKLYTGAYSGFDEEEKNLYMWYYWYDSASSTSNERQGFMDFNWGEETGINTISGKAQNTVRKYIQNGSLVIVKDSHKYNALGTEIK